MPLLFNLIKKRYIKHAKKKITLVTSTNQNNQIIQKIIQNINKTLIITGNTAWSSFQDYVNNFVEDGALLDYNSLYIPPNVDISTLSNYPIPADITQVIGIGGGKIMDVTKFLAQKAKKDGNKNLYTKIIPSILSTTAWLNSTASLKHKEKVVHEKGHYDQILIFPDLITTAPSEFTFGGVLDILVGIISLKEWELEKLKHRIYYPKKAITEIEKSNRVIIGTITQMNQLKKENIPLIVDYFIESMGNCYGALSGRPLDGGEHLLYYLMEEKLGNPGIHGRVIAFNMLIMTYFMEKLGIDVEITSNILKKHYLKMGIQYQKFAHELGGEKIKELINNMSDFITLRKSPYSLWNYLKNQKISELKLNSWVESFLLEF